MNIISCVGGHSVSVYAGAEFDPSIRKYRGGVKVAEIPFSGKLLNCKFHQEQAEPIIVDGIEVPTSTPVIFDSVDPIPEEADWVIVSAMYVSACKATGVDTSKLLTMGGTVVDEDGRTIGVTGFNHN